MLKNSVKRLLIFCILNSAFLITQAQVNLVPNPSFEIHDTCPIFLGGVQRAVNWFTPTQGSSDYFHSCSMTPNNNGVPGNAFGNQMPLDGSAYSGLCPWMDSSSTGYREYISTRLVNPLIIGAKYYASFYLSLADSCRIAIDQIGGFFSVDTMKRNDALPFNVVPHISNQTFNYLADRQNWMRVSGAFIADSAYNYLTIGNFRDSANTNAVFIAGGGQQGWNISYYYIDYVCLSTDSLTCNGIIALNDISQINIDIYPNPANERITITSKIAAILILRNIHGVPLHRYNIDIGKNDIYIGSLEDGVYLVEVVWNNSILRKKLIIKK